VLVTGLVVTGCGASGSGHAPGGRTDAASGERTGSAPPSPRTASDEELCAELVGHWSRKALEGDTYGDYQSMGLSDGQYDILRAAVAAARPVEERQGTRAAHELMARRIREGCVDRYRDGGPTGGPWQ
jgi:hypothetical protein